MTFTSFTFLLFFPLVVVIYNLIPQKCRLYFLLLASLFFYISLQPVYVLLLAGVTISTYLFTREISKERAEKKKGVLQVLGIIVTIFPLFFFKYFGFLNQMIVSLFDFVGWHVALPEISFLLPIGISFYTFMAIGYIVDVYNEDVEFEPSIGATGLFLSFFPLVLSGPIERAGNMFPQFKNLDRSSYDDLVAGVKMMLWGYFMKLCVADRLGIYVDAVFNNVEQHNGTTLLLASILYPFQVYADLGGYSLIAIGVARCLGLRVIPNFKRPFFATSMSEFWRRWHISLIQWLTDYVYNPLAFALRRWKIWGIVIALMLTFLISGIWHGATLTFIIWGMIQGVYLSVEALFQKRRIEFEQRHHLNEKKGYILLCCIMVFVLFAFSQIFGRCMNVEEACVVIKSIFMEWGSPFIDAMTLGHALPFLFLLLFVDMRNEFFPHSFLFFEHRNVVVRYFSYVFILFCIVSMGVLDSSQFIYFQF